MIKPSLIGLIFALSTLLSPLAIAGSITVAGRNWTEYNNHWYSKTNNFASWNQAEAEAVSVGGHLVTINDAAENAWVTDFGRGLRIQNSNSNINAIGWIGLNLTGGAHWSSGEPITYNNYLSGINAGPQVYIHVADYISPELIGVWGSHVIHNSAPRQPQGIIERTTSPYFDFNSIELSTGSNIAASLLGGAGIPGGVDLLFDNISVPGTLQVDPDPAFSLDAIDFAVLATNPPYARGFDFDGVFKGNVHINFNYSGSSLVEPFTDETLKILHILNDSFDVIFPTSIDPTNKIISFQATSFSSFALVGNSIPTPTGALLAIPGFIWLAIRRRPLKHT